LQKQRENSSSFGEETAIKNLKHLKENKLHRVCQKNYQTGDKE
jgi:hypothetical protein